MGSTPWLALLIAAWLGSGLAVALWAGRSGHDLRLWIPLGMLLGPVSVLVALERDHLDRRTGPNRTPAEMSGSVDVLAGIDGSLESVSAARGAVRMLRPVMSTLTLASVLDFEEQGPFTGMASQSEAYAQLVDVALELGFEPTMLELLYGEPAERLVDWATGSGAELIVVGARGSGLRQTMLGSVAAEIVKISPMPVLVGPAQLAPGSSVRQRAALGSTNQAAGGLGAS